MRSRIALLLVLVGALVGVPTPARAAEPEPKVAVIVGPSGSVTERHRARAKSAIADARRWTSNIAYVASPYATWPAVREALQGASIVIYYGHGNGWPSRYRDHLYPPTQNGFGLNPVAGVDDDAHQYFGEEYIRDEVQLAQNAVVLLHHLCYASGNTEPGLPEGTQAQAKQRIDNYAAGFIAAGADAVVADARSGANHYVRALLGTNQTIEQIWRSSPSVKGNTFGFASTRHPGYSALMDPDTPNGGFYRSLVGRLDLAADELRRAAPAGGSVPNGTPATPVPAATPAPTLADLGFAFGPPDLRGIPGATGTRQLEIPVESVPDDRRLPAELFLGVRWDALEVDPDAPPEIPVSQRVQPPPAPSAAPSPTPDLSAPPEPDVAARRGAPSASAAPTPAPALPPPALEDPAAASFVVAERSGNVVTVVPVAYVDGSLVAKVRLPATPGLYRLVTTLHDRETIAFDERTQALFDALVVRVLPLLNASYAAPEHVDVGGGVAFELPVTLTNSGFDAWADPDADGRDARVWLTATWVPLAVGSLRGSSGAAVEAAVAPYRSDTFRLSLTAPATAGQYLVVLDVVTPDGSLTAKGIEPGIARVSVR